MPRSAPRTPSKRRTPPFPNWEAWTTARFWGWLRSQLRKAWLRWPPRYAALGRSKHSTAEGQRWKCELCGDMFRQKDVEVDHISPVGQLKDYEDLPVFVANLFTSEDKLRVLCKQCHSAVTAEARKSKEEV